MKHVVDYVTGMVPSSAKASPIVRRISKEMLNDIVEFPPELVEMYVKQIAGLLTWVADGVLVEDVVYPPGFEGEGVQLVSRKCVMAHCTEGEHMYISGDDA